MMKNICTTIFIILVLTFATIIIDKNKSEDKEELPYFIGKKYERRDTDEPEILYLGKDNHFSYYEASGSPVKDSDLCPKYKYDDKNKVINVICEDENVELDTSIEIKSFNDTQLIVTIDSEDIVFYLSKE